MLYLIQTIHLIDIDGLYKLETCYVISSKPPFDRSISTVILSNISETYLRKYAILHG